MKFEKVLVPIDGSPQSEVAVDLAVFSAGTFSSRLKFVYLFDTVRTDFGELDSEFDKYERQTKAQIAIDLAVKEAKKFNLEVETEIIEGDPEQILVNLSKDFDMMILGIPSKLGHQKDTIGAYAAHTVENSHCPVLTLRSTSRQIKNILLPVESDHIPAIDIAIDTAKLVDGKITVFSAESKNGNASEICNHVAEKIKAAGIEVDTKVGKGKPADEIVGISGIYDLIVMGTDGKHGFFKFLSGGSVAETVMTQASCPVTIVRNK